MKFYKLEHIKQQYNFNNIASIIVSSKIGNISLKIAVKIETLKNSLIRIGHKIILKNVPYGSKKGNLAIEPVIEKVTIYKNLELFLDEILKKVVKISIET